MAHNEAVIVDPLADELGLAYREAASGERIKGIYRRTFDLASGRYSLIGRSREFTLAPWRPVLERARGRAVSRGAGRTGVVEHRTGASGAFDLPILAHQPWRGLRGRQPGQVFEFSTMECLYPSNIPREYCRLP